MNLNSSDGLADLLWALCDYLRSERMRCYNQGIDDERERQDARRAMQMPETENDRPY